ncbi:hypothetical protein GDO81_015737 [Engystomops pustulosus]|uniref:Uncharacterized protein n=1 Tax=Engystomops pustulosus TaxID=76066 RepID=A0AAV7ASR0_ENGPU|nr:hypothetical protein GDO81_015737 [Engystomops pustulosus]
MATFLPYASCYGNKPALQLMGMNRRCFSFLGTPPCLINRRRQRARPTTELTLIQLTQLIRVLQQLPHESNGERTQSIPGSAVSEVSRSCHPKIFGRSRCLICVQDRSKQAG